MPKCPYYQSSTADETLSCQHRCLPGSSPPTQGCQGDFVKCTIQFNDQQLSDFIGHELRSGQVEFIFNTGDDEGALKVERGCWLALELIRRFGRRQTRGIESILKIKNNNFIFSLHAKPMSFGDAMVFPIDTV